MTYQWIDYTSDYASIVETFLDDTARKLTGCDEGWQEYYDYLVKDPSICFDKNFWAKVISAEDRPIAVIAMGLYNRTLTVSEFVVLPEVRGKGHGTAILRELLTCTQELLGVSFRRAVAVIYPNNQVSQRAFEKAGFVFESSHPDGDAWYYTYTK